MKKDGEIYTEIILNCTARVLEGIIPDRVDMKLEIYTDGWKGYDGLVDVGFNKHYRVKHGENKFSKGGGIHINGIEKIKLKLKNN